jgi:hypothetical protein
MSRHFHASFVLAILATLPAAASAVQTVNGATPNPVTLPAGGAAVSLVLTGTALADLAGAVVMNGSSPATGVQAELQPSVSGTSRTVRLQALSTASPVSGLRLRLTGRRLARPIDLPNPIAVIANDDAIFISGFVLEEDSVYAGWPTTARITLSASPSAPLTVEVVHGPQVGVPASVVALPTVSQIVIPVTPQGTGSVVDTLMVRRPPYTTGPKAVFHIFAHPTIQDMTFADDFYNATASPLVGGTSRTLKVRLLKEPPLATTLAISSSAILAQAPSSVPIAAGQRIINIPIALGAVSMATQVTLTLAIGSNTTTVPIAILPQSTINQFSLSADSVTGGSDVTLTIGLAAAAPAGGTTILLDSNAPAALSLPASVVVPAGSTSASVILHTLPVVQRVTAQIEAQSPLSAKIDTVTIKPPAPVQLNWSAVTVNAGDVVSGQLTLNGAVPAGSSYTLSVASSDSAIASVPSTVTVAAGAYQANVSVTTHGGFTQSVGNVAITVTAPDGATLNKALTVSRYGRLSGLTVGSTLIAGSSVNGSVTLDKAAGPPGHRVIFTVSNPQALTLPAELVVPAGQTSMTFAMTAASVATNTSVQVEARDSLNVTQTRTVDVAPLTLASITAAPAEVDGGQPFTLRADFGVALPIGSQEMIQLVSSHPAVQVPATMSASAGAPQNRQIQVQTSAVATDVTATITATRGADVRTTTVTVRAPASAQSVSVAPDSVLGGSTATLTVTLSRTVLAPTTVTLTSSNTNLAQVPATVTVQANQSAATVNVSTSNIAAGTTVLSASAGGATVSDELRVAGAAVVPAQLSASAATVGPNTSVPFTLTLKGEAPAGGLIVALSSSHPALVSMPANIVVPAGQTSATFTLTTLAPVAPTSVSITATASNRSASASITITP